MRGAGLQHGVADSEQPFGRDPSMGEAVGCGCVSLFVWAVLFLTIVNIGGRMAGWW